MNQLFQSAFAEALGWTLIDSLWQFGAVWISYVALTSNGNKYSANKRHLLALLGTAAGTLLFFLSLLLNYYFPGTHTSGIISRISVAGNIVPYLSIAYLPAVLFFGLRLFYRAVIDKQSYRRNLTCAPDNVIEFVSAMSQNFGIIKKVAVWVSAKAVSPLTLGFWKPIIILPVAMFNQLTPNQVEAVLTHELYHIKRKDYLLNILLTMSEVILFFNPFARLMCGIVKKERENSCDDKVVASGFDAWEYSQALYVLGENTFKQSLAVAATGPGKEYLLQRIKRMLNRSAGAPSITKPSVAFFLCLLVAGIVAKNHNQATEPAVQTREMITETVVTVNQEQTPDINAKPESKGMAKNQPAKPVKPVKTFASTKEIPEAPPPPPAPLPDDSEDVIVSYVTAPETIEFTIIDPAIPTAPEESVITGKAQPYVPASSFYFTEIDTTAGKKIIRL